MTQGETYKLEVIVKTKNGENALKRTYLYINQVPYGGNCSVTPTSGKYVIFYLLYLLFDYHLFCRLAMMCCVWNLYNDSQKFRLPMN